VPDLEVEERYRLGYENLNRHLKDFDNIHIFDTSTYNSSPAHILSLRNGKIDILNKCPEYLGRYCRK